jgi:hypothetical protein
MNGHLLISVVENFVLLSTIFAIVSFAFAGAAKLLAQRRSYPLQTNSLIRLYTWTLALGVGQPGKEIQQPMAIVILGGIFTSTFLNMIVIPALF